VEHKNHHYLIVTSSLAFLIVILWTTAVFAAVAAGTITHLSGALFAKKADGNKKALSKNSTVDQGDTIITEKRTYARIKFIDGSEITLRPDSQFKIEAFSYDKAKPKEDKATFDLVKGGLRTVTGFVGKRGNPDSYKMKTPPAVIGIRGTIYEVKICAGNCGSLPNGIYFFVPEGSITITNPAGTQTVSAGQYAYAQSINSPPVILPKNPGIEFVLPKDIQKTGPSGGCIVR